MIDAILTVTVAGTVLLSIVSAASPHVIALAWWVQWQWRAISAGLGARLLADALCPSSSRRVVSVSRARS
jgi:hypothetical protein